MTANGSIQRWLKFNAVGGIGVAVQLAAPSVLLKIPTLLTPLGVSVCRRFNVSYT